MQAGKSLAPQTILVIPRYAPSRVLYTDACLVYISVGMYLSGEPIAKDTRCPLCGDPDSGHMLGHCQHKELKALYIARHDKAMREIIKEVRKGQNGSHFIIADVCQLEGLRPNFCYLTTICLKATWLHTM